MFSPANNNASRETPADSTETASCHPEPHQQTNNEQTDGHDVDMFADIVNFRTKHFKNFIFCHVNINSFRHKFACIQDILRRKHVDYLAISESKLDSSFPNAQFGVEGFTLYRQDHTGSSGGIIIYVRSDLPHRRITHLECNAEGLESVCIEIAIGKRKTILSCIYKHPKVTHSLFKDNVCLMADKILQLCADAVFIGDMNCCPTKSTTIKDICDMYNLTNLIKGPTCHKGAISTLLDVILVTNPRYYANALNCPCIVSDFHNFIGAATKRFAPVQIPRKIHYRSYKHFIENDFLQDLSYTPFHVGDIFDDIEDVAWFNSELLRDVIDSHVPIRSKVIKCDSVPYMNGRLRKAYYKRNMARNKFKKFGKICWEENRRQRNEVVAIRKQSMSKYFSKNCSKHDKTFWQTISPFMTDKKFRNGNSIILNENDETVVEAKKVCNIFNDYFSSIASTIGFSDEITSTVDALEKHKNHPSILKIKERYKDSADSFTFKYICTEEIKLKLKTINVRKATGYDGIPGKLLRLAQCELSLPLTNLFNTCILQSCFPNSMKCAEVSPVYKKSDNLVKGNYRPVSVLTTISKIFESVLNDQLVAFFGQIFDSLLGAFRSGYSCQSILVKLIDDWKAALDDKNYVGALFMDLSKAFDCLPHGLLIAKLHAYGLNTSACGMVASYLSNRTQRVKIGNDRSDWNSLTKGVPQGSILGPLLFNVFMNDMFFFIKLCSLINYADDNSLYKISQVLERVISALQNDGNEAIKWFKINGMQANPTKFQGMILSPHEPKSCTITLADNTEIKSENTVNLLGVLIDDKLNFTQHISACCKKAARQLNALARISKYLDFDSRKIIYNSFIVSNFNYCPMVWHFCGKVNNDKIEKIQERSLRILYRDYDASYEELLKRVDGATMLTARLRIMALEVGKCIAGVNPTFLNSMFEVKPAVYNMRRPIRLVQTRRETVKFGIKTFSYTGSKLWNELPLDYQDLSDIDIQDLKKTLKTWMGPDLNVYPCHYL